MGYVVQNVLWREKRHDLKQLREKVFVCEYHIPKKIEFDNEDSEAFHIVVVDNDQIVASGRLNKRGVISRVAVLSRHRNTELYALLFSHIALIAKQHDINELSFNCNLNEKGKFIDKGYHERGAVFMEAGIARQRLSCPISSFDPEPFTLVH